MWKCWTEIVTNKSNIDNSLVKIVEYLLSPLDGFETFITEIDKFL